MGKRRGGAFKRMLKGRAGETWTLKAWAGYETDDYDDELPVDPVEVEFRAIPVDPLFAVSEEKTVSGQTRVAKVDLLVDIDLTLPDEALPERPIFLIAPDGREWNFKGVTKTGSPVGSKKIFAISGGSDAAVYL